MKNQSHHRAIVTPQYMPRFHGLSRTVRCSLAAFGPALGRYGFIAAMSILFATAAHSAPLAIPSDRSDGPLIVNVSTNIDLSKAVTGVWSDPVNPANVGKGIYDPAKWAVVFKYSSVSIASGATVTFSNHPTGAPVVWLVDGSVSIDGALNLDGQPYISDVLHVPQGGPGGFRGGAMAYGVNNWLRGAGFGPGGYDDSLGFYGTLNQYGNAQIVPLIGGSGGAGQYDVTGSGGGGAILIAASSSITVNGICSANAGHASGRYWGSGGAIRLVADQILGSGKVEAISADGAAFPGRIRLEANSGATVVPNPPTVAAPPTPLVIWPASDAPTVRVVSVHGLLAPLDPTAPITAPASELTISTTNVVSIVLQTANFPTNGTVNVYIKPRNSAQSITPARLVSGDSTLATWQLTTNLLPAYTVIQARAVSN